MSDFRLSASLGSIGTPPSFQLFSVSVFQLVISYQLTVNVALAERTRLSDLHDQR